MPTKRKPSTSNSNGRMSVPAGYTELVGSQAEIWLPKARGEYLSGKITDDRIVKTKKGRKEIVSRILTIQDTDGLSQSVWVSASLKQVFDKEKSVKGWNVMIVFEGLRKIKGQGNPMKVFRVYRKGK